MIKYALYVIINIRAGVIRRGGTAIGIAGKASRFLNLMSKVLHWWLLYFWCLHNSMDYVQCFCYTSSVICVVYVPYKCMFLDVPVVTHVLYVLGCGLVLWLFYFLVELIDAVLQMIDDSKFSNLVILCQIVSGCGCPHVSVISALPLPQSLVNCPWDLHV
jgi:hypothetical protein